MTDPIIFVSTEQMARMDAADDTPPAGLARLVASAQLFNGLCECRGPLGRHPFHGTTPYGVQLMRNGIHQSQSEAYVGKHRYPEK